MSFERQNSLNANECGRAKIKEATTPSTTNTTTPSTNTTSLYWKWHKIRKRWGWPHFLPEVFNQEQIICPGSKNKKSNINLPSSTWPFSIYHLRLLASRKWKRRIYWGVGTLITRKTNLVFLWVSVTKKNIKIKVLPLPIYQNFIYLDWNLISKKPCERIQVSFQLGISKKFDSQMFPNV